MAILKKRTSSKQLPEARGLDRAPLGSIIRGVDDTPSLTGRGSSSITSTGGAGGSNAVQSQGSAGASGRPFTSAFTNPATTKPTLTTKTSSTPKTTLAPKTSLTTNTSNAPKTSLAPKTTLTSSTTPTTKPTITNKTSTTPTTKTTSPTSTVRPTVKPNVSNPNSTTNKVVNALTGAAIGAGTKLLIDKITGKPTTVQTGPATGKPAISGGTRTPAGGATTPAGGARPPAGGTKTPTGGATRPPAGGTSPSTGGVSDSGIYHYPTNPSGGSPYDDEGNLMPGWQLSESNDPVWVGLEDSATTGSSTTGGGTRGLGGTTTGSADAGSAETGDTTVAGGDDVQYFDDGYGNIYTMNSDGSYTLYSEADGSAGDSYADNTYVDPETGQKWTMADDGTWSTEGGDTYADNTYYDEESGATWRLSDSGMWTLEGDDPQSYGDSLYADNIDYTGNEDYLYAGNDTYEDYYDYGDYPYDEYAKRGGLITMMKNGGGVKGYAGGGVTQYYDDGSYTITYDDGSTETYDSEGSFYDSTPAIYDEYETFAPTATDYGAFGEDPTGSGVTPKKVTLGPGYGPATYDATTGVTGNRKLGSEWPSGYISNGDGTATTIFDDGSTMTVDENMNPVYSTEATDITSAGGGSRPWYSDLGNLLTKGGTSMTGLGKTALEGITGALGTTAGAAGAGALVATLLGQDFGGGTGNQNQGLDMSKVGVINPRTTDFGIGPTNFVGYEDYGTSGGDYTPNAELLKNLNAPGYNPVNEGDYGYEEVAAEEAEPTQKMASGGLSSMSTPVASYYTFGQPADILANLGMRQQPPMNPPEMMPQIGQQQSPQQTQQQGLPQQAPPQMAQQMPQGMPQQGIMPQQQGMPPPMRKGGLPRASDVPIVEGRMDFRKGSAVHGPGDGQSDDIPAMLADGEYVIDAETVAQIGNGSTKAGAQALDKFRESIRSHKRSAPVNKIPPKTKALTSYLKG